MNDSKNIGLPIAPLPSPFIRFELGDVSALDLHQFSVVSRPEKRHARGKVDTRPEVDVVSTVRRKLDVMVGRFWRKRRQTLSIKANSVGMNEIRGPYRNSFRLQTKFLF